ncbi:hypothetical protein, partial [Catenuloplanes japonicus]|uniref:hypothetical protein n=1 Tax=Catenuloplanes japonicus TaxID=33876 RepID=UPI000526BB4F
TPAPTRAPSPQPEVPGAFPDGAEPGDVEAGRPGSDSTPKSMDSWVSEQLIADGFLSKKGPGNAMQTLNHRRNNGIWVPFERSSKTGVERVWVRYSARPVDGAEPTYHGNTAEMRLNTSVDSFFRHENV